jgi:signal transduction histidine kinase
MLRSFRIRLVIAFVALFAAVSAAVSFAGMTLREQQLRSMFDRDLILRTEVILDKIRNERRIDDAVVARAVAELSDTRYFRDSFVQVYNDQSQPVARTANLGNQILKLRVPFADASMDGLIVEGRTVYDLPSGPTRMRGLRIRFGGSDGRKYLAIVAANPDLLNESLRSTRWLFFAGNIGGLGAAGAAAWFVTGAMARRIKAVVEQIEQVGPESLDLRIRVNDRDEISDLAQHINAALDRLKAGFDTQERFIHDASHELKTPVATVQAEAQAILLGQPTHEELTNFARATNDEMRRLGRLTEALLLLTRSNEIAILSRFKRIEIHDITTDAIHHLSTMASDHNVRVVVQSDIAEPLIISGDPDLMEAMVSNLIRNAIRFSPKNAEVRVHLGTESGRLQIRVEDDGPGIPDDIMPHIFDRFFESSAQRVRRGAGLGLAIARTVAELHQGTIRASNHPGGGARLVVTLPLQPND